LRSLKEIESSVIADKLKGLSDSEIGEKYKITYRQLEQIMRKTFGVSISSPKKERSIKRYEPKDFQEETTTVWSFKSRGDWATHSGEYRGNWSPYIPRNLILKYSSPGELVLDYFCGAGTTAVEAKLLGRRCIALDINEKAVELARRNIDFQIHSKYQRYERIYEPELFVGDARDLSFLDNQSVDLICAHPPYANIIHYTNNKEGDLSFLEVEHYLRELEKVANESYRVLKPGRKCAILIGDMRKHKHVVPLGFKVIDVFLKAGFKLKELVIKRQHNCKTTGFWYENSIKYNFLLLAHEYLPIFEKPLNTSSVKETSSAYGTISLRERTLKDRDSISSLETTTVWIFRREELESLTEINVIDRYQKNNSFRVIDITNDGVPSEIEKLLKEGKVELIYVKSSCLSRAVLAENEVEKYLDSVNQLISIISEIVNDEGYLVIQTRDVRVNGYIEPMAKRIVEVVKIPELSLKEIIVIAEKESKKINARSDGSLQIVHQYLLVFKVSRSLNIKRSKSAKKQ
jgi:DNA modification methylase